MKFIIDPDAKVYDAEAVQNLSLRDVLKLEAETAVLGRPLTMADIRQMSLTLGALKTDAEREVHPDAPWMLAVTIWTAKRQSGEDVTFGQAIDFPMRNLRFLPEPLDHKRPANPTKARSRKGPGPRAQSAPAA